MFTGIIEKTGKIKSIDGHFFDIEVFDFLSDVAIGDSIAINGVCATVVEFDKDNFKVEIMPETFRVTTFGELQEGSEVNLEKSLRVGDRLDGHFVLGHVDGVGEIKEIKQEGEFIDFIISFPESLKKYVTRKGTMAINGVSLTIAEDLGDAFRISLISYTREITNFKNLKPGDKVNLEVDVIARYLEKLINNKK